MAWSPKFDLKTFGDLYFMGVDEKFKYEDGEKLIKIIRIQISVSWSR